MRKRDALDDLVDAEIARERAERAVEAEKREEAFAKSCGYKSYAEYREVQAIKDAERPKGKSRGLPKITDPVIAAQIAALCVQHDVRYHEAKRKEIARRLLEEHDGA